VFIRLIYVLQVQQFITFMDQMIFWTTFILFIHTHGYAHGFSFDLSRRNFIIGTGISSIIGVANHAEASYSAYAAREKDWAERNKKGGKL
jgi:hypothetical protein